MYRVLCHGHSHRLATEVSRQLVRNYETTCRLTFDITFEHYKRLLKASLFVKPVEHCDVLT